MSLKYYFFAAQIVPFYSVLFLGSFLHASNFFFILFVILLSLQDVKSGECFRLDHLIKQHFEKEIANKKTPQEEKDQMSLTLARLDGMNMVRTLLRTLFIIYK